MTRQMTLCVTEEGTDDERAAKAYINPVNQGANTLAATHRGNETIKTTELFKQLESQIAAVADQDLSSASKHLAAQAITLGAVAHELMQSALHSDITSHIETYMKLALKAQNQAKSTWEAISRIQNPPMAGYVAQQNVGYNQQVNNSYSGEIKNAPNELLEAKDGERLDTRATSSTSGVDQELEALEAFDGA